MKKEVKCFVLDGDSHEIIERKVEVDEDGADLQSLFHEVFDTSVPSRLVPVPVIINGRDSIYTMIVNEILAAQKPPEALTVNFFYDTAFIGKAILFANPIDSVKRQITDEEHAEAVRIAELTGKYPLMPDFMDVPLDKEELMSILESKVIPLSALMEHFAANKGKMQGKELHKKLAGLSISQN